MLTVVRDPAFRRILQAVRQQYGEDTAPADNGQMAAPEVEEGNDVSMEEASEEDNGSLESFSGVSSVGPWLW